MTLPPPAPADKRHNLTPGHAPLTRALTWVHASRLFRLARLRLQPLLPTILGGWVGELCLLSTAAATAAATAWMPSRLAEGVAGRL